MKLLDNFRCKGAWSIEFIITDSEDVARDKSKSPKKAMLLLWGESRY